MCVFPSSWGSFRAFAQVLSSWDPWFCSFQEGLQGEVLIASALRKRGLTYPLKLQAQGKLIFYRHIAHITPNKLKSCVLKR